jgi:hypothetical protein
MSVIKYIGLNYKEKLGSCQKKGMCYISDIRLPQQRSRFWNCHDSAGFVYHFILM